MSVLGRLAPDGPAALNRRRGRLAQLVRASRLHRDEPDAETLCFIGFPASDLPSVHDTVPETPSGAVSSAVERLLYTQDVAGSIPAPPTILCAPSPNWATLPPPAFVDRARLSKRFKKGSVRLCGGRLALEPSGRPRPKPARSPLAMTRAPEQLDRLPNRTRAEASPHDPAASRHRRDHRSGGERAVALRGRRPDWAIAQSRDRHPVAARREAGRPAGRDQASRTGQGEGGEAGSRRSWPPRT
jgi:hypothetical protein